MYKMRQSIRRDTPRRVASYVVAILAVVGLLSAASRPLRGMLADLLQVVPFVVPQTAAITLVFVSFTLVFTALGLRREHRLSWILALVLLVLSAALHLSNGFDYRGAIAAPVAGIGLAAHRKACAVLSCRAAAIPVGIVGMGGTVLVLALATLLALRADIAPPAGF